MKQAVIRRNTDALLLHLAQESSCLVSDLHEGGTKQHALELLEQKKEVYLKKYGMAACDQAAIYISLNSEGRNL